MLNLALYALHDARTPMTISLISIVVNYITAWTMMNLSGLGHAGLALSTSAVAIFGSVVLFAILSNRIGGVHGRELLSSIMRIILASIAMGVTVAGSSYFVQHWLGAGRLGRVTDLAVSIPIGLGVFYTACRVLRVAELELVTKSLLGPLRRLTEPRP